MTDAFFRAGVGAFVVNASRHILVMKRKDVPDQAWQLPQGGIRIDEDPLEALYRELREETGLAPNHVRVLKAAHDWLTYELPVQFRNQKVGWGQVQRWYLCQLLVGQERIKPDHIEFEAADWVTPGQLLERAVAFRKEIYLRLVNEFEL